MAQKSARVAVTILALSVELTVTAAAQAQAQTGADEAMARDMHKYWVAFAKTGRPDPAGLPAWPEYHASTDRLLNFTEHGPVPEADSWKKRLDVAERFAERTEAAKSQIHSPQAGQ